MAYICMIIKTEVIKVKNKFMKAIKFFAVAAVIALSASFTSPLFAQEDGNRDENGKVVRGPYLTNKFVDNTFVGVAGGITLPFHKEYKTAVSPALDIYVGKWITPCVGVRLGYTGITGSIWSPVANMFGTELDTEKNMYKTKYGFTYIHGDLMWNISNAIGGYKETRLWNFIPYLQTGFLVGTSEGIADKTADREFGTGVGLLNNIRVHERVNVTLDIRSMFANGRFHAAKFDCTTNLTATVGVAVNLFRTNWDRAANYHNPEDADKVAAAAATAAALAAANEALEADKAKLAKENEALAAEVAELRKRPEEAKSETKEIGTTAVYFEIGQSVLTETELQHLDSFMQSVLAKEGNLDKLNVTLMGSADSNTGTMERNQVLSEARSKYVYDLLTQKYGISPEKVVMKSEVVEADGKPEMNRAVILTF